MGPLGGFGLVPARLQIGGQAAGQVRAVRVVVGQQRPQFPFGEGLHPGVVAEQVQQAAEPQVRQPVVGAAVGLADGDVPDLPGLEERPAHVA